MTINNTKATVNFFWHVVVMLYWQDVFEEVKHTNMEICRQVRSESVSQAVSHGPWRVWPEFTPGHVHPSPLTSGLTNGRSYNITHVSPVCVSCGSVAHPTKDHLQSCSMPSILFCKQVGPVCCCAAIVPWTFFVPPKTEKLVCGYCKARLLRECTILVHNNASEQQRVGGHWMFG